MTNDHFRESIEFYFEDIDIDTKQSLEVLMRKRGFFNASNPENRQIQQQKLLDDAWRHLKSIGATEGQEKEYYGSYKTEKTEGNYIVVDVGYSKNQVRDRRTGRIVGWVKK